MIIKQMIVNIIKKTPGIVFKNKYQIEQYLIK